MPATPAELLSGHEAPHAAKAWQFFRSMGSPRYHVAPMVDQSELPFRMLSRKYGATCAYTPMFHARLFCEDPKYRQDVFTTCPADRPLLVQFCANDPDYLVRAAKLAAPFTDGVDINFGCPQRIAKRGNYGSFLMDNLPLVETLVTRLAAECPVPVTCKIRVFPQLEDTLAYARMIERAGCCLLAVHGRTREQKDNSATRADWDQIKAVKQALSIPVLANGNIRHLADAQACMEYTGCDGVLSAESLLEDPALFSPHRLEPGGAYTPLDGLSLCEEYLRMAQEYPVAGRMVKGHIHKMAGAWLSEYTDVRETLNRGNLDTQGLLELVQQLSSRVQASGRTQPVPALSSRALERLAREEARKAAIEEQQREEAGLQALADEAGPAQPVAAHAAAAEPGSVPPERSGVPSSSAHSAAPAVQQDSSLAAAPVAAAVAAQLHDARSHGSGDAAGGQPSVSVAADVVHASNGGGHSAGSSGLRLLQASPAAGAPAAAQEEASRPPGVAGNTTTCGVKRSWEGSAEEVAALACGSDCY